MINNRNGILYPLFLDERQFAFLATCARICVWIFAFLSGYGLTITYMNNKKSDNKSDNLWMLSRLFHLLIPYQFFIILFWMLTYKDFFTKYINNGKYFLILCDFFAISDLIGEKAYIGVFWYISLTMLIILLIPILYQMIDKFKIMSAVYLLLFIRITRDASIISQYGGNYSNYLLVVWMGVYFAYHNVFELVHKIYFRQKILFKVLLAVFMIISCLLLIYTGFKYNNNFYKTIAVLVLCTMLFFVKFRITDKVLVVFGEYSYYMFLGHTYLRNLFGSIIYFSKNIILSYFTLVFMSILFALVFKCLYKIFNINKLIIKIDHLIYNK